MASVLLNNLRSGKHKDLFKTNDEFAVYSTGFKSLDSINAFRITYTDSKGNVCSDIVEGVIGGRFITIVGSSGTGKSTLADQIAWNIIKDFDEGLAIHVDVEQTVLRQRLLDTIGITTDDPRAERFIIDKHHTYVEDVLTMVDDICKEKEAAKDAAMYEADGKWFGKKTIKVYQPTVIIVDSLPSFTSKTVDTAEVSTQMATNREVNVVAQFYTKLLAKMNKYNVTIIATNHIRPKIVVDVYNQPPPQLMLLKASETMPRGQAPVFYASTVLRLNASGKSALLSKEEYGFEGFKCIAQAAKSKTSFIGGSTPLIFTEDHGFDEAYTMLLALYDNGLVCGMNYKNRDGLYVASNPELKFSKANFGEKYKNNPEFKAVIDKTLEPIFTKIALDKDARDQELEEITKNVDVKSYMVIDKNGNAIADNLIETESGKFEEYRAKKEDLIQLEPNSDAILNIANCA